MTEKSELNISLSNLSNYESYSLSFLDKDEIKSYPIRCSKCSKIAILIADFKNKKFCTKCDEGHQIEYFSSSEFLSQSNKDIDSILCNGCQKNRKEADLYKCKICDLCLCNDCKSEHREKRGHSNFSEINKIDTYCDKHDEKFKYFNNENKDHLCETCLNNLTNKKNIIEIKKIFNNKKINDEYQKNLENIAIIKNSMKAFNNWINELIQKVNNYCETLNNYFYLQNYILSFLKADINNTNLSESNFNAIMNYEAFNKEKNQIDTYLQQINDKINNLDNRNTNLENKCSNFCEILNSFDNIKFAINAEETKNETIKKNTKIFEEKERQLNLNKNKQKEKQREIKEIDRMKKLKVEIDSEVKCFCKLNEEKCILVGLKSGNIEIMEFYEDKGFKTKLVIKEFQREIKFICELDINLFAATDGISNIKIFQLSENLKQYSLVQTLYFKDDIEFVYTMISFPILSSKKRRYYLCIGDENHILIWESNKHPIKMKIQKNYNSEEESEETSEDNDRTNSFSDDSVQDENDDNTKPLYFTEIKDIELYTPTRSIIEVNEKYIAAVNINENCIKFFDVENFEEVKEIDRINASNGSNILTLLPKLKILVVGCKNGFVLISTETLKVLKLVETDYSVTCIEFFDEKIILCGSKERNGNKIRQYKIRKDSMTFKKLSEISIKENEVWNLKNINNTIFYTKSNKFLNYFR